MNDTNVLSQLRARLESLQGLKALLVLFALTAGLALLAMVADAMLDLPESLRAAAPWILAACVAAMAGSLVLHLVRLNELRLARTLETRDPSLGNVLTNAVQLAGQPRPIAIAEILRLHAVERGRTTASSLPVWPAERSRVIRVAALATVVLAAWITAWLVFGEVFHAVLPRFLDPRGDHPPYSRLRIDVRPGDAQVLYGGEIEIRATVAGRPVDKLYLVTRSANAHAKTTMFLAPDHSFFQTLGNLREPTEYCVTDGQARSRRLKIGVRYTPRITMVELNADPPRYTGRPGCTLKLGDEPQSFLIDTRLNFRVSSNRPLSGGTLTLTPVLGGKPVTIPLKTEKEEAMVSGEFVLTEPVTFSVAVRDVNGLDSNEPRKGRISVLPDNRPQIIVLQPGRNAVATPETMIPVRVQAQDDYGVARVAWFRGFNKSIERSINMKLELKNGATLTEADGGFPLKDLGVKAGDSIDYFFEAVDNYPRGPNVTTSRLYTLQIISMEQYQALLRQMAARKALFQPYQQLDQWLRRLAERARELEKKANDLAQRGSPAAEKDALAKEMTELTKDLGRYREALGKLMEQSILFDVERAFRESLVLQSQAVGALKEKMQNAGGSGLTDPKSAHDVAEQLAKQFQKEHEEVGEPFRHVASVAQLLARADTFTALALEQARIVQMLRRFQDRAPDSLSRVEQMELQEMAQAQRRVEQGLRDLVGSLPDLLAKVPTEPYYEPLRQSVKKFSDALRDAKIQAELGEASAKLSGLDAPQGFPPAQRAAEKMDALISRCRGMLGEGKQCLSFQPALHQSLGNSLEQIIAALNGANSGDSRYGYGMFGESVSLYGPDAELAGADSSAEGEGAGAAARGVQRVASDARDADLAQPESQSRVRLQRDARFPLRYRDLVGEYFRVIAESEEESR